MKVALPLLRVGAALKAQVDRPEDTRMSGIEEEPTMV